MAVKIRLQRKGRKKRPFYYIVVADSRSPRDGKFIERIGSYDPIPQIPYVEINTDRAIHWLNTGAIPTKTVRNLLSKEGVLYRKHLLRGVKLGVLTQEEADAKFSEYLKQKAEKIRQLEEKIKAEKEKQQKSILSREAEINLARQKKIAEKRLAELEETSESSSTSENESEASAEEESETEENNQ